MQTQNYGNETTSLGGVGGEATRERLDRAATKAHETVDTVHRRASEVTDRVTTEGDRMYQATCDWIADHPMQAVCGALFVGYVFGKIRG